MKDRVPSFDKKVSSDVASVRLRPMNAADSLPVTNSMKKSRMIVLAVYTLLILLGVGTGYLLVSKTSLGSAANPGKVIDTPKVVGVQDAAFKDCATGVLEKEGLNGEGTHKLIREGGPSQTAYLTSSIVDMDQYVALNVKVCGQTMAAKKVSWLMDVGRLEILDK